MEISDKLLCLYSAKVEETEEGFFLEVPSREVTKGEIQAGQVFRVGLIATDSTKTDDQISDQQQRNSDVPVKKGEQRTVDIETIGEQGDGIARVERGYVIIVPDTEKGERVTIEITEAKKNVGFGEVIKRHDHYE